MAGKDLKSIVDRVVDLPTLPDVVTKIMGLIEDPRSTARQINDVMSRDPALAAKILKLVNSSFYGLSNRVTSITQAITILGFNTIRSLAISASVFDLFGASEQGFSYEAFWEQSIGCASVCHYYARHKTPRVQGDTAFVVGLLHGIGKLILDQYAPSDFQDIIDKARFEGLSFTEAEAGVIETSYADIGYWLAERWKLADQVQHTIKYQNRVLECPEEDRELAALVSFSLYACRVHGCGAGGDFDEPQRPEDACAVLNIDADSAAEWVVETEPEIEKSREMLAAVTGLE